MRNKWMVRVLMCLLILCMILPLTVACKKNKGPQDDTSGNVTLPAESTEGEGKNDNLELPEGLNFNGKEFVIKSMVQTTDVDREFGAEITGTTGDVIDDAVFNRNESVKALLNCKIRSDEEIGDTNGTNNSVITAFQTAASAGTAADAGFHIGVTAGFRMVTPAYSGQLANLKSIADLRLDKDYYSQGYNTALSIGNSQYLLTGKMSLGYYRYMMINVFNKNMFKQYGIEEPYQMVLDGKWTFEAMANIAKKIYVDNGTEQGVKDEGDTYGYFIGVGTGKSHTDGFMSAANLRVLSKDENNYYKIEINQAAYADAIDEILKLINAEGTYTKSGGYGPGSVKFKAQQAAMVTTRMHTLENPDMIEAGNIGDGYGILPLPKASEEQIDYVSYAQDQCFLFGIPVVYGKDELIQIGQFLEAYSWASYHQVKPKYYDVALTARYVSDENSTAMLEIIDSKVYVDPVNVYLTSGFNSFTTSTLRSIYATNNEGDVTLASTLAAAINGGGLQAQVDEMNERYQKIENDRATLQ